MAVMAREAWTDERLDDLNKKVDNGFGEMREEFRAVRGELGGQIAALQRMMIQLFFGMIVTVILGFGGMIVALVTQGS
jgi:tetrahydromethanopterin S-methyltransferase subunit G